MYIYVYEGLDKDFSGVDFVLEADAAGSVRWTGERTPTGGSLVFRRPYCTCVFGRKLFCLWVLLVRVVVLQFLVGMERKRRVQEQQQPFV